MTDQGKETLKDIGAKQGAAIGGVAGGAAVAAAASTITTLTSVPAVFATTFGATLPAASGLALALANPVGLVCVVGAGTVVGGIIGYKAVKSLVERL